MVLCEDNVLVYYSSIVLLSVTSVNHERCEEATHLKLTSQHGYLASHITQQTACGSYLRYDAHN